MNPVTRRILLLSGGLVVFFFAGNLLIFLGYFDFMGDNTPMEARFVLLVVLMIALALTVIFSWKNDLGKIAKVAAWSMPVFAGAALVIAVWKPWLCRGAPDWGSNRTIGQECLMNGSLFDLAVLMLAALFLVLGIRRERRNPVELFVLGGSALLLGIAFLLASVSSLPPMNMG
jgi:hypothetical protein